jgi:hypothetical protein
VLTALRSRPARAGAEEAIPRAIAATERRGAFALPASATY